MNLVGESVNLSLWCRSAGTPTLPDAAPVASIYSGAAKVDEFKMPIQDRYGITGFFSYNLFLGRGKYEPGRYRVRYRYAVSGATIHNEGWFDVVAGGTDDGSGISMYFYRRPKSDFVLIQCAGGRLLRKRNPS